MNTIIELFSDPSFALLAQAELETGLGGVLRLLRMVSYLLSVMALIIGGLLFGTGRTEAALFGVTASGLLALAPSIVNFAFSETDGDLSIPD